ncbi:MAG: class I SAM-dependent methyltransferase [Alphaproteobacteria bacterium]|nr:MAG: class I SAM-dependent methyltransferase [Alphaproteobacteria bacterium]
MSGDRYATVIDFTKLQSVTDGQIAMLREAVNAQPGISILDAMSGPATASSYIAEVQPNIRVVLLDSSPQMLEAGRTKLKNMGVVDIGIDQANLVDPDWKPPHADYRFDVVLLRSALHETPKDMHPTTLQHAAAFLNDNPESRLVVWQQVMPTDRPETLRDIIAMRDAIGGHSVQRAKRYFPTLPELTESVQLAGLSIRSSQVMEPQVFHPPIVGDQDFKGHDRAAKVAALNSYIQVRIPEDQREALGYEEAAISRGGVTEASMKIAIPVQLLILGRQK